MAKRTVHYPMGSVSCATMRPEDLIPTFCHELRELARQKGILPAKDRKRHLTFADAVETVIAEDSEAYWNGPCPDADLESLFDALGEYAAPYFYFGAHPGDGADYGFWLSENWDQDAINIHEIAEGCEQQGDMLLKVNDLSEVPVKFRGEVAVVNDHGNVTLYYKSARTLREIWSVV